MTFPCPVCSLSNFESVRQLKTHLLLKHPQVDLCLFCVEKKGWSDQFASQSQYNQHYWDYHEGSISHSVKRLQAIKADKREWRDRKREAQQQGKPSPKRPRPKDVCFHCPDRPEFSTGHDFDRHLISRHKYDYCKLCHLIGTSATVRYHIGDIHKDALCHICCSASPVFTSLESLQTHLGQSHGLSHSTFECLDCPQKLTFEDRARYQAHLLEEHLTAANALKPLKKRFRKRTDKGQDSAQEIENSLHRVVPIPNESGQDCFSISVFHLLAQTEILSDLEVIDHHFTCDNAACIAAHMFDKYRNSSQKKPISIKRMADNYASFGVDELPMDCGDFLRCALESISSASVEHRGEKDIKSLFHLALQWKFECSNCKRFMVMNMSDSVLRINGAKEGSLEQLLNNFLHKKECSCGEVTEVFPGVKQAGRYIFLEVDRSCLTEDDTKELVLYSLQLNQSYSVFGFRYLVLGTINYNLEAEGGGHYVTNLFPGKDECVRIHEAETKTVKRKPDFDTDTVVVALKKVEMTANDLRRIELEIEYETSTIPSQSSSVATMAATETSHVVDEQSETGKDPESVSDCEAFSIDVPSTSKDTTVYRVVETVTPEQKMSMVLDESELALPSDANTQLLFSIPSE